jgi:putative NADH-flavin reductase
MKIALIGASGFLGSAIRDEALARGHDVTALVHNSGNLASSNGMTIVKSDVFDTDGLATNLSGHDVVISAFSGHSDDDVYGHYMRGIRSIIEAAKRARAPRLMLVGGAGSLEIQPGELLIDSPTFPAQWRATAEGARDALSLLRSEAGITWTVVSPPPAIHPGERTGKYRVGGDRVLFGDNGPSDISTQDFAVAFIDEVENGLHPRERFTVAY